MKHLNHDQLDGLAKLCFDLAKAGFVIALFPINGIGVDPIGNLLKIILGLIGGVAFTYLALLILETKEKG